MHLYKLALFVVVGLFLVSCKTYSIEELLTRAKLQPPPQEQGVFLPTDLVDLSAVNSSFKFDVRYATKNNFLNHHCVQQ